MTLIIKKTVYDYIEINLFHRETYLCKFFVLITTTDFKFRCEKSPVVVTVVVVVEVVLVFVVKESETSIF